MQKLEVYGVDNGPAANAPTLLVSVPVYDESGLLMGYTEPRPRLRPFDAPDAHLAETVYYPCTKGLPLTEAEKAKVAEIRAGKKEQGK